MQNPLVQSPPFWQVPPTWFAAQWPVLSQLLLEQSEFCVHANPTLTTSQVLPLLALQNPLVQSFPYRHVPPTLFAAQCPVLSQLLLVQSEFFVHADPCDTA